ncbi:hypothetical protein BKA93DRAFT_827325 [Sparassis latifolia]
MANAASKYATFPPRMTSEGIILHEDFQLPSFELVQKDLAKLRQMKATGPCYVAVRLEGNPNPSVLPLSLSWTATIPDLFAWAIFVSPEDVAPELVEDVIFVLKIFVQGLQEGTDAQLEFLGYAWDPDDPAFTKSRLTNNTRFKLSSHLLNPTINRPGEALPYIKAIIDEESIYYAKHGKALLSEDPYVYVLYGEALVYSNIYTEETRSVLEKFLQVAQGQQSARARHFAGALLQTRMHLSLVLLQLGVDPEEQKEHTQWSAKFLRRNPTFLFECDLKYILARPGAPPHPVLAALGGPKWLEELGESPRRITNLGRRCMCGLVQGPQTKLFRCVGCQSVLYCSRACQKKDWSAHKEFCRAEARRDALIKELQQKDPFAAQRAIDGKKWTSLNDERKVNAIKSALGVHRDPSRGRTHIVMQLVEYTPKHRDMQHKFRVAKCGVFRLEDVIPDIVRIAGWDTAWIRRKVQQMFDDIVAEDGFEDSVPMLEFRSGQGIEASLGCMLTSRGSMRRTEHNPNWRQDMNKGDPPAFYRLPSGVMDVEHIF